MTLEVYLAFLAASVVLLFVPGPTILLVVSYAVSQGRRSAVATIAGVMAGDFTALALVLAGLGALLNASAELFWVMKVAGAVYLVYLGVRMWRAPTVFTEDDRGRERVSARAMALDAFTVTVLNPKSGMFLVAFLPQFMDPAKPLWPQNLVLGGTFLALAFTSVTLYALLASEIHRAFASPRLSRAFHRAGAGALIGAGVLTAAMRRA